MSAGFEQARVWQLDAERLRLQHGPIDLIVQADGPLDAVRAAHAQACLAFPDLLPELCRELDDLRRPVRSAGPCLTGPVAQRMARAARCAEDELTTPMVAVAGSVADELLVRIGLDLPLCWLAVNNGGDIAVHMNPGARFRTAVYPLAGCAARLSSGSGPASAVIELAQSDRIGGIATSGWAGRSHSLGIADAVTVLAHNAATADMAATLIANAVNLPEHVGIVRQPACDLAPDTDLGDALVTVQVPTLSVAERRKALRAGECCARDWMDRLGLAAVYLSVQGEQRLVCCPLQHKALRRRLSRSVPELASHPYASLPCDHRSHCTSVQSAIEALAS